MKRIQGNDRLDEMRYNIHDSSAVSEVQVSADDSEFMATRACVSLYNNPRIRLAFVGSHPVVYQLMDAFNNSGCARHRVHRFDSLAEARRNVAG